jgi:F-type H+-transporting ATPase subunit a
MFYSNNKTYALQTVIYFVKVTLKSNLSMQTYPHFIYIFYLFLYILICNLTGMVAYSFTVTSALIITFFFSANFFIGSNIYGFFLNYSSYFNLFIPKGVPKLILPMLFLIEIISYFSRVISLAVRLFANMMSGHALLKILLSFA